MSTITQFINSRTQNAVKNQFVIIEDNGTITFQSYNSKICNIDHSSKVITIYPDWDCSVTTSKHFYNFLLQQVRAIVRKKEVETAIADGALGDYKVITK